MRPSKEINIPAKLVFVAVVAITTACWNGSTTDSGIIRANITVASPSVEISKSAQSTMPNATGTPDQVRQYTGRFSSTQFGFRVTIPKSYIGLGTPVGGTENGFLINLSPDGTENITVSGEFSDAKSTLTSFVADNIKNTLRLWPNWRLDGKSAIVIGGVSAIQVTGSRDNNGTVNRSREIYFLRVCKGSEPKVAVIFNLDSRDESFEAHQLVLNELLNSVKFDDICD